MQQVILGLLLTHGPLTLYAVKQLFSQGISLFYSASFGSIQRSLRQLVDNGLVVAADKPEGARGSKPYAITDAGRAAFHAWMASPIDGSDAETIALSKTFFLGVLDEGDRGPVLETIRTRLERDLGELEQVAAALDAMTPPEGAASLFAFQRATLDYGIRAHTLARDWFAALGDDGTVRG
ncbi:helix-turn-helix transcriptional regulator [Microbacterium koreense]|uniref:Helix-turn-helix transcriptional regulator n=1 Tax=Microbacterium koreense TaxID=323761 RepID=A0ABW2ZQV9_9MICO